MEKSGNQGITVSVPVIEYAKALGCSKEKLYRALVLSNLIAIHEKTGIGQLGRNGMRETDREIVRIMIQEEKSENQNSNDRGSAGHCED